MFPLDQIARALSYSAVKLFSFEVCDQRRPTWTSQTDGRTDDILWHSRSLRSIARQNWAKLLSK